MNKGKGTYDPEYYQKHKGEFKERMHKYYCKDPLAYAEKMVRYWSAKVERLREERDGETNRV